MNAPEDFGQASAALRSLAILEVVVRADRLISLTEIVDQMALPKPTVFRLLSALEKGGWILRQPGDKDYTVGSRLADFGLGIMMNNSVRMLRHTILANIGNKLGETCNITMLDGNEIVYIDRAFSERSGMQVVRAIGGRGPLHLTSTGKLFLSVDEPKAIRAYATRTGLAGHNKNSITDLAKLERELSLVRARGYARDNEELELGVRCMAAGIHDDSGKLIAGLSISAPADRLQEEWLEDLVSTASQISATLGYAGAAH